MSLQDLYWETVSLNDELFALEKRIGTTRNKTTIFRLKKRYFAQCERLRAVEQNMKMMEG